MHSDANTSMSAFAVRTCVAAVIGIGLAGCGSDAGKNLLGTGKRAPDEFAVYERAPLTVPSDFGLRPPAPGTAPAAAVGPRDSARTAVFGESSASGGSYAGTTSGSGYGGYGGYGGTSAGVGTAADSLSDFGLTTATAVPAIPVDTAGVEAMLVRTGAANADPDIRARVNQETAVLAEEDQSFVERLIYWGEPTEYGTLVDPAEEQRRIKENQALGRTVTTGQTPTIERRKRALLEGIFD